MTYKILLIGILFMFIEGISCRRSLIFQMAVKHRVPNTTCVWTEQDGTTTSSKPRVTSKMPIRLYECQLQSVSSSVQSQTSAHRYNLYIQKPTGTGVYQMYTFFWRFDKKSDQYRILVENREYPFGSSSEKSSAILDKSYPGQKQTLKRQNETSATPSFDNDSRPSTGRLTGSAQDHNVVLEKSTVYAIVSAVSVVYIITISIGVVLVERIKKTSSTGRIEEEKMKRDMYRNLEQDVTKGEAAPNTSSRPMCQQSERVNIRYLPLIHRQRNGTFPDEPIYDTPRSYKVTGTKNSQNKECANKTTGNDYLEILPTENTNASSLDAKGSTAYRKPDEPENSTEFHVYIDGDNEHGIAINNSRHYDNDNIYVNS